MTNPMHDGHTDDLALDFNETEFSVQFQTKRKIVSTFVLRFFFN